MFGMACFNIQALAKRILKRAKQRLISANTHQAPALYPNNNS